MHLPYIYDPVSSQQIDARADVNVAVLDRDRARIASFGCEHLPEIRQLYMHSPFTPEHYRSIAPNPLFLEGIIDERGIRVDLQLPDAWLNAVEEIGSAPFVFDQGR
jgi:hypothetical protein